MKESIKITFEGIGTHWWIEIFENLSNETVLEIKKCLENCTREFDNNYSRFKSDSYIGILNNEKKLINFNDELYEMINYSRKVSEITDGHFDICAGTQLENLGYDKNYSFENKNIESKIENGVIEFTPEIIQIKENISLDLGGIGKGWLVDKLSNILFDYGILFFFVNGGGDIFCSSNNGLPVKFFLENPFNNNEYIGEIDLINAAIACSSGSKRSWVNKKDGKIFNHLVDAKDGQNIHEIASVFTYSNYALNADTASTALFVSPLNKYEVISKNLNVEFLVINSEGNYFTSENYPGKLNL